MKKSHLFISYLSLLAAYITISPQPQYLCALGMPLFCLYAAGCLKEKKVQNLKSHAKKNPNLETEKHKKNLKAMAIWTFFILGLSICSTHAFAGDKATNIGDLADNVTNQLNQIRILMIAVAYISGIGFTISAIFKFKQHKDNPTQVPVGTAFAILAVGTLLMFLPGIFEPAARSIFGTVPTTPTVFTNVTVG